MRDDIIRVKDLIKILHTYDENLVVNTIQDGCGCEFNNETYFIVAAPWLFIHTEGEPCTYKPRVQHEGKTAKEILDEFKN